MSQVERRIAHGTEQGDMLHALFLPCGPEGLPENLQLVNTISAGSGRTKTINFGLFQGFL